MIIALGFVSSAAPDRATVALLNTESKLRGYAHSAKVSYPPRSVFIRVFKAERELEVWGGNSETSRLKRLVRYRILAASGTLGPKRRYGDLQVPEGVYTIDRFNPNSSYHLSLGLNYPNSSDRIFAGSANPGADIFIHGNAKSAGCLAMGDRAIEEIYTLARMASGKVTVFILPAHSQPEDSRFAGLWGQLFAINRWFDEQRRKPSVTIDGSGSYRLR